MPGLSPKLPVRRDPQDGFGLTKTYAEMIHQNFKGLILTSPGERIMDPNFGVGLRAYLFEPYALSVQEDIRERVLSQTARYMPFIEILSVAFLSDQERALINPDPHRMHIRIEYSILPLDIINALEVIIDETI